MDEKKGTEEFVNKAGTDNHVGVSDDIGREMQEAQKVKYEDELEAYQEEVAQIDRDIENYNAQWLLDQEEMQLQFDNFGMIEEKITHKVHLLPRFWEISRLKYAYKMRQEEHQAQQYLAHKQLAKEKGLERIDIVKSNLTRITQDLEE